VTSVNKNATKLWASQRGIWQFAGKRRSTRSPASLDHQRHWEGGLLPLPVVADAKVGVAIRNTGEQAQISRPYSVCLVEVRNLSKYGHSVNHGTLT
jgi:hypothetical protein